MRVEEHPQAGVWAGARQTRGVPRTPNAHAYRGRVAIVLVSLVMHALLSGQAAAAVGTILLVVGNSASLTTQEQARKTLIEGWGYTTVAISASASAGTFDTQWRASSAVYICNQVVSGTLSTKLLNSTTPVIIEADGQALQLGIAAGDATWNTSSINLTNTSHYITSTFTAGSLTICTSTQGLHHLTGAKAAYTSMAEKGSGQDVLIALERGSALNSSGTAAGRRVFLPWGGSSMDINALNSNGLTIMQRSIEWCLMPLSHWKLDESSGSTATDWIAGRNGTRFGASWTTGKISGGLLLNGSTEYVTIADNVAFDVTSAMTIAGWVKANSWPNDTSWANVVLRKGDANPNNWQLCIWQTKVKLALDANDNAGAVGNTTLATNTWYHVAGTWDGVNVRLYLNGVLDNTPFAKAAPIGTDARAVYLGGRINNTDVLNGVIDDVRFYNRCLTAAEIADLAASAKPRLVRWQQVAPQ